MFQRFLDWLFPERIINRQRQKAFEEKFPCLDCRPDCCTFFYNIPCVCPTCKREYYI